MSNEIAFCRRINQIAMIALAAPLVLVVLVVDGALGAVIDGPIVNPANSHAYYVLTNQSWTDSEIEAVALGGHLVTINDEEENLWVFDTFVPILQSRGISANNGFWIGLSDNVTEGTFVWISGEEVTYTNWGSGEPNNLGGIEDYVHMVGNTYWNDLSDSGFGGSGSFHDPHAVVEVVGSVVSVDQGSWGGVKSCFR